ncbi:MAG: PAS domain-containing protein [Pseudomonadota bacterium]|nr:PAS domain-containing protein [Pseudomonadota bacterium]
MTQQAPVNILLVDDQLAKLMSHEAILADLGENLLKATSGREALDLLLRHEIAVILVDVMMPELDGFELAQMIRDHPRFRKTAIIFISAIQIGDDDRLRGYELGGVDYVPVPVVPAVLRAKVKVFVDLHRKTRELEQLNLELESRVAARTAELERTAARLNLALEAARLGTWERVLATGEMWWSEGKHALLGYRPGEVTPSRDAWCERVHPDDLPGAMAALQQSEAAGSDMHSMYRLVRPDRSTVWVETFAKCEHDASGAPARMHGVVMDISAHKKAEEQQRLMVRELHHRVKNTLATVQAIASFTARFATDIDSFRQSFVQRLHALGMTHTLLVTNNWSKIGIRDLLSLELDLFDDTVRPRIELAGEAIDLPSDLALSLGMAFHELTINAVKYGSLSSRNGSLKVSWVVEETAEGRCLRILWREQGGPTVATPQRKGFGSLLIDKLFTTQTGAHVEMNYRPKGLEATFAMALPVDEPRGNGHAAQAAEPASAAASPRSEPQPGRQPRVSAG